MKTKIRIVGWMVLLALSTLNLQLSTACAQGTAFTYQGRLNSGANPAGGIYDLRFTVYDAASNGSVWGVLTNTATPVTNGLFTVMLDFGSGAGFPGIPISLCRPEIQVTLAESQGKKAAFLQEAVRVLGLAAKVHAGRAETAATRFDCVVLRAVDRMELAVQVASGLVGPAAGWR